MFVIFSFKVQVGDKAFEGPTMGAGDVDLLKKLFPDNSIWGCKKSELGNQMYPTVKEMIALYNALLSYSAEHEISTKVFVTGNVTGGGPLVTSSAASLFRDLIKFCEDKLGFKKSKKMQVALIHKQKMDSQKLINKAKRVRKSALFVTTENSIYKIGAADKEGRRSIVRLNNPLSNATSGQIIFLQEGKHMRFFLDGDPEEYETSTVRIIANQI